MWFRLRASRADPDFAGSLTELLQSTSRYLILTVEVGCLVWYFLATAMDWESRSLGAVLAVVVAVSLPSILALYLLPRRFLTAQTLWLTGLAAAIALAIFLFRRPEIAYFYALLPLVAVVTVGWQASLLVESLIIFVFGLSQHFLRLPYLPPLGPGVVVGGAVTGTLGWAAMRSLLTATQWSLSSYEQARQKMEEAREQRLELAQAQEDLVHINRELARLSDQLKAMVRVAEEARRTKQEFVANVSHELRTPLNMIVGFSEMILQTPETYGSRIPPALLADLAVIHRNAEHLADLVDDVLDLSRIESDQMALNKEHTRFAEIVEAAAMAVRPLFDSKGLYLQIEVPNDLPPVFCDRTRIHEVVLNLLSNAGRFTERGGVRLRARQEEAAIANDLLVTVSDTGRGIAAKDISKLFQPFQQVDGSIRRRYEGTGLGLSISKRFIELHGGRIWVESEEGVGTTFSFRIPLVPVMPISGAEFSRGLIPGWEYLGRTRPSRAPQVAVSPRFVVLETGDSLRRLLVRYLGDAEIVPVTSLEQALEELSRVPAQALLVNGPSVSDALERLKSTTKLPSETPAIICSLPGIHEASTALGVSDILVKPVSRQDLLKTLDSLEVGGGTVLIVDDEPDTLQLFGRMLASSGQGYHVLLARDGQEAMGILRECRPDVVLLDLIMPNLDGFELLEMRSQDPVLRDIPVVIVSARDPAGQPIVSSAVAITRGGGLSVQQLITSIQFMSVFLSAGGAGFPVGQGGQVGGPVLPAGSFG